MRKSKDVEDDDAVKPDAPFLEYVMRYSTDAACREYLEQRLWPEGPVCPRCKAKRAYKLNGKSTRKGVYKCAECRKPYTVTIGTIFEDTHIPLPKWFATVYLMMCSKKGVSAHQVHRMVGVSYESAWFMCHRIRHGVRPKKVLKSLGGTVEADETYVGGKNKPGKRGRGAAGKTIVAAIVQRGKKIVASVVPDIKGETLKGLVKMVVRKGSNVNTDELSSYNGLGMDFNHQTVNHGSGEYVRGKVHTNTAESFFALLKRGIHGIFHHVSADNLPMYCHEFAFRWGQRTVGDAERFDRAFDDVRGRLGWYLKGNS